MTSPVQQIYEQADAASAGGQSVQMGQTDQAKRSSIFSTFEQQASVFNANTSRMFAQMQQHSRNWMEQQKPQQPPPPAPGVDPAGEAGPPPLNPQWDPPPQPGAVADPAGESGIQMPKPRSNVDQYGNPYPRKDGPPDGYWDPPRQYGPMT